MSEMHARGAATSDRQRESRCAMNEPTIHEEVLGRLTWRPARGCWEGEASPFGGRPIHVAIYQDGELWNALQAARSTYDRIAEAEFDLRTQAAEELLDFYNDEWNDEVVPLNERGFVARLALRGIVFFPSGEAELHYDDGGLFDGQTMIVAVDPTGRYQGVGFPEA
jgi:hypothetical protein